MNTALITPALSVTYDSEETKNSAIAFATEYGYPYDSCPASHSSFSLNYTQEYVELKDIDKDIAIHIDFISGDLAHRQKYGGGRGQSIAKAIGLKQGSAPPIVIDATAGLAKDAYVLASLGCPMTLIERSPVIAELIHDAIKRAEEDEHFQSIIKTGFNVVADSSINYLTRLAKEPRDSHPEVIYLDPMYPERKKSASVKKNMQLLQKLLGKDDDTEELLNVALRVARKRVVVKRPKGAPNLSTIKPTYQVSSKKTRYDIYLIQK